MGNVGFIGLGIMGKPMAKNLISAGHTLYVFDIQKESAEELAKCGAKTCKNIEEVCKNTKIIITMLPNSPHVKNVILSSGGILETAQQATLLIDMSSIAPIVSKELELELAKKGIRMIDAPVSGGEPKAIDGTLSIMCGGKQTDFDEALPLLNAMGKSVVLVGEIGSGNTTKLANQIIVALNIAAVSEAFLLATKAGVNPELVFNAIRGGLAGSTVMEAKMPMILNRNFNPGFKIDLHIKDLNNALDTGKEVGSPLFLTSQVTQMLQSLSSSGNGDNDHSAIAKFYENLADMEISK